MKPMPQRVTEASTEVVPTLDESAPPAVLESADSTLSQELYAEDLKLRIAARAYELYELRGRQDGYDLDDWLQAEREIIAGYEA